jgi:hypothetical protein
VDPRLTLETVQAVVTERRAIADAWRRHAPPGGAASSRPAVPAPEAAITVRFATPRDAPALDRLAQLDSGTAPAGPALVAVVDGDVQAALPLVGGRPVSDPFHRSGVLLRMLELRAAQLGGAGRRRRLRRGRRLFGRRPAASAGAR